MKSEWEGGERVKDRGIGGERALRGLGALLARGRKRREGELKMRMRITSGLPRKRKRMRGLRMRGYIMNRLKWLLRCLTKREKRKNEDDVKGW